MLLARGASNPPELTTRPARRPDQGTGAPRRQAISAVRSSRALNGVFKNQFGIDLAIQSPEFFEEPFSLPGLPPAAFVRTAATQENHNKKSVHKPISKNTEPDETSNKAMFFMKKAIT
ncbi:hypothetical protein [Alcaligenes sp. Marseille-Q7550]